MLGKLQRAHPTLRGHFAPAYLVDSNMLRAYLFFIYDVRTQRTRTLRKLIIKVYTLKYETNGITSVSWIYSCVVFRSI